jgi:thioredoxin reductase (NADPH)
VQLSDGDTVTARTVITATGVSWRRLGVDSLDVLVGPGVFYGAAGAEAQAMEGQDVFVVGAGNSAGQAAVHLAKWAASVTVLVRGNALGPSMSDYLLHQIKAAPNITVRLHTEVADGHGGRRLEGLVLRDTHSGASQDVPAAALFVMIGAEPRTAWLTDAVERDSRLVLQRPIRPLGTGHSASGLASACASCSLAHRVTSSARATCGRSSSSRRNSHAVTAKARGGAGGSPR